MLSSNERSRFSRVVVFVGVFALGTSAFAGQTQKGSAAWGSSSKAPVGVAAPVTKQEASALTLASAVFPKDAKRGMVYDGLEIPAVGGPCADGGLLEISGTDSCTHGPDSAPAGVDVRNRVAPLSAKQLLSPTPQALFCEGDGVSGNRTEVMYVRASDQPDRYATYVASIRAWAEGVDDIYSASAAETGGDRHVRFVTTAGAGCEISVLNVVLSPTIQN